MSVQEKIRNDMLAAMKARDAVCVSVLRGLITAFTNELVAMRRKPDGELSDEEALAVVRRQAKQRKDSVEQFSAGGRADLAEKESAELHMIEIYLPAMMPREEIEKLATAKKAELGIADAAQKNQLMGILMKELKGRADGSAVKEVVDTLFQ